VADGSEDCIYSIAFGAFEEAAAHVTIIFQMTNDRFHGATTLEFALDGRCQAVLLAGDEYLLFVRRIMSLVALINVTPLCGDAGDPGGLLQLFRQGVSIVGIARHGHAAEDKQPTRGLGIGHGDRDFDAKLVALVSLALGDALHLWGVERIEAVRSAGLLGPDGFGPGQGHGKHILKRGVIGDLALNVADHPAQAGLQPFNFTQTRFVASSVQKSSGSQRRPLGGSGVGLAKLDTRINPIIFALWVLISGFGRY